MYSGPTRSICYSVTFYMCPEIDRVGPAFIPTPSRHILIIDLKNSLFTVYLIYINPYFTVGLQYQATWRALCLGLRIRHVSRGEGGSFVPQNPLILRDRVPSFWGWLPPVLRPSCLRFLRSAYLRFLLRPECLQCFRGQSCLRCVFKAHVPSVFEALVASA